MKPCHTLLPCVFCCMWEQWLGQDLFVWVLGGWWKGESMVEGLSPALGSSLWGAQPSPQEGTWGQEEDPQTFLLWGQAEAGIRGQCSHDSPSTFFLQVTISWAQIHVTTQPTGQLNGEMVPRGAAVLCRAVRQPLNMFSVSHTLYCTIKLNEKIKVWKRLKYCREQTLRLQFKYVAFFSLGTSKPKTLYSDIEC